MRGKNENKGGDRGWLRGTGGGAAEEAFSYGKISLKKSKMKPQKKQKFKKEAKKSVKKPKKIKNPEK